MKDYKTRSWFMKKDICPVSGLPVSCREVYVSDFPDADYVVEMAKLGDRICLTAAFGYVRSFEIEGLLRYFDAYISGCFTSPFFYIEDDKYVRGADADARNRYIDYYISLYDRGRLLGFSLYNLPALYRFSFNITRRLKIKDRRAFAVKAYADAIVIARRLISISVQEVFEKGLSGQDLIDPALGYNKPDASLVGAAVQLLGKCRLYFSGLLNNVFTRRYSRMLLDYMAAIDWHKSGPIPSNNPMSRDPFIKNILDPLSYLKSDIDDAFEQRDRAEAVLRESEKKYRLIVEHAKAGICEYDYAANRITSANEAFLKITGYGRQQVLAMDPLDMFSESSRRLFMRRLSELYSGKTISADMTYEFVLPDSEPKWVLLNTHIMYEDKMPVSATVVITDVTEMKRTEERLLNYQARLKQLSINLAMSEERQRKKLAAQLHEQVSQELFVALMDINEFETLVADPLISGGLTQIKERLSTIIVKTRDLTFDLSPPALYDLGLAAAVESLAETLSARHGLGIKTRFYVKPGDIANDDIKVIIYRAIRELLHNCVKHAKARNVSIDACMNGNMLEVIVEDDGIGFNAVQTDLCTNGVGPAGGGFGLFDIREKLSHLEGELVIGASPGRGCRILMKIPLSRV